MRGVIEEPHTAPGLLRFAVESFVNGLIAFVWPVIVVGYLEGWGLLLIGITWWRFERWAKPWIGLQLSEPPPASRVP